MRTALRLLAVTALLAASLLAGALLAGCGSGGGGDSTQHVSPAIVSRANANCRQLRRDLVALGNKAFVGSTNLAKAATERVVKPSIPLVESFARRQQQLAGESGDPEFELYARLFEPITILAHERLHSGEESDSPFNVAARGFEILTSTVADEQREVAREAGLADCAIDFEKALTSSLHGG
jgi:hypothetical protein